MFVPYVNLVIPLFRLELTPPGVQLHRRPQTALDTHPFL